MSLEENPILKIHKLMFLTEKLIDRELVEQFDVSFSQFRVLSVISRHPGISQKHIAQIQEMTQAAVSRHIDVLERLHYVALATNSANRKEHNLHLTRRGNDLYVSASGFVFGKSKDIMEILRERQRSELDMILDSLLQEVRKEYDDDKLC